MQAYASNYTGNAKINRLIFIAEKTTDTALALSALKLAADDLKRVTCDILMTCKIS
jgi:COP9 signalosome complex subunit 1